MLYCKYRMSEEHPLICSLRFKQTNSGVLDKTWELSRSWQYCIFFFLGGGSIQHMEQPGFTNGFYKKCIFKPQPVGSEPLSQYNL